MNRIGIAAALLGGALLWTLALSLTSPTRANATATVARARDGSSAIVKFLDKSGFADIDQKTGRSGRITLRLDVLDPEKKPILGLNEESFSVKEEGIPCTVTGFSAPASQAVNVIFVIDKSGSMADDGKMGGASAAMVKAIDELKVDRDQLGIIAFDQIHYTTQALARLSADVKAQAQANVRLIRPGGGTVIARPVLEALATMEGARPDGVKMVILMTDGLDEALLSAIPQIASLSEKVGVPVHAIGFGNDPDVHQGLPVLKELAKRCNGNFYHAPTDQELAAIFRREVQNAVNECTLAYYSPYPKADGLPRNVEVTIRTGHGEMTAVTNYQVGSILAAARQTPVTDAGPSAATESTGASFLLQFALFIVLLAILSGALASSHFIMKGTQVGDAAPNEPAAGAEPHRSDPNLSPAAAAPVKSQRVVLPPPPMRSSGTPTAGPRSPATGRVVPPPPKSDLPPPRPPLPPPPRGKGPPKPPSP